MNEAATAAQFLADLCQLLPEGGVLPLQEGGAHRDLVLLDAASVAGALGCLVVLIPAGPVLLILKHRDRRAGEELVRKTVRSFKGFTFFFVFFILLLLLSSSYNFSLY